MKFPLNKLNDMLDIKTMYSNYLKDALVKSLNHCPFCGGVDLYFKLLDQDGSPTIDVTCCSHEKVGCFTCGSNMRRAKGVGVANQWNDRNQTTVTITTVDNRTNTCEMTQEEVKILKTLVREGYKLKAQHNNPKWKKAIEDAEDLLNKTKCTT